MSLIVFVNASMGLFLLLFSLCTGWKNSFSVIIGGDEVRTGKPSPEMWDAMMYCLALITEEWAHLTTVLERSLSSKKFYVLFYDVRFLEAARRLNMEPSSCLVIEDSLWVPWFLSFSWYQFLFHMFSYVISKSSLPLLFLMDFIFFYLY